MMSCFATVFFGIAVVSIPICSMPLSRSHRSMPTTICGITAGQSTDSDVKKQFGTGYFVESEDHLGGRYYVDPAHRITFHTTIGVDSLIFTVEIRQGVRLPTRSPQALKRAECPSLNVPKAVFGSIHLGDSLSSVRRKLGEPDDTRTVRGDREERYDGKPQGDALDHTLTLRYRHSRLAEVAIYNGE